MCKNKAEREKYMRDIMGILSDFLNDFFETPKGIGRQGEEKIESKLGWAAFFGYEGLILKNVYIPKADGTTTEIDLLYITPKGIFVIESKNYSGYIFGNEKSPKWTMTKPGGRNKVKKYQFYNPIWQNNTHIKFLKEYLDEDVKIYSFIVFSNECELKDITYDKEHTIVCYKVQMNKYIKSLWGKEADVLTKEEIHTIYDKLKPLTNQEKEVKKAHIENIEKKINSTTICPKCGGELVLRIAKKGKNAGKKFYGCSNYPKCKYTREVGKEAE